MSHRVIEQVSFVFKRTLKAIAISAGCAVLLSAFAPAAQAAERVRVVLKKQSASVPGKRKSATVARKSSKSTVIVAKRKSIVRVAAVPTRPSFGQLAGLHSTTDQLGPRSALGRRSRHPKLFSIFKKNKKIFFLLIGS